MILTVTLNAAMDKRYVIDSNNYNSTNRVKEIENTAGGKGLNVSRVLKLSGNDTIATGFVGGNIGNFILEELNKEDIKNDFIKVKDESRCCINLINLSDMSQTEYLEPGFTLKSDDVMAFKAKFIKLLDHVNVVTMSGSAPKGVAKDIYKELVEIANKKNKKVILDVSGDYLKNGILAKPYAIKPNIFELETLVGKKISSFKELEEAAKDILNQGVEIVIVSCGKDGIYLFEKDNYMFAKAPKITLKNATGSGDSSVAGFSSGIDKELSIEESLKLAVAFGSANASEEKTGFVRVEIISKLLKEIEITKDNHFN